MSEAKHFNGIIVGASAHLARENIARCKAFKASGCRRIYKPHVPRPAVPWRQPPKEFVESLFD